MKFPQCFTYKLQTSPPTPRNMASANASQQDPTIVSVNFCFASPSLHGTEMDTGGRAPAEISTGQVKVEACITPYWAQIQTR